VDRVVILFTQLDGLSLHKYLLSIRAGGIMFFG